MEIRAMESLFLDLAKHETEQLEQLLEHANQLAGLGPDREFGDMLKALDQKILPTSNTTDIASAGAVFGQALVEASGLRWVMVFDNYGLNFGVQRPGTSLVCFPLSMVHKRVESGENLQLTDLLQSTVHAIEEVDADEYPHSDFEQCVFGLESVDLVARLKDDSIMLVVATVGQMRDDARTIRLLTHKLATYEQFAAHEYPDDRIVIKLVAGSTPDAGILAWLDQQAARLRAAQIGFEVVEQSS